VLGLRLDDSRWDDVRRLPRVRPSARVALGVQPGDGEAHAGCLVHHSPADAMTDSVIWTKLALYGCPGMECIVHTTKDGRTLDHEGEVIPHERRPYVCGKPGRWALGMAFLCDEHACDIARLMEDDIDEIDRAWKEMIRTGLGAARAEGVRRG